jgi:hypothetical protein
MANEEQPVDLARRFRPPTRPDFFAAASPARVRSTSSSRSICAKLAIRWKKKATGRGFSIDAVREALKVHASMLKLAH